MKLSRRTFLGGALASGASLFLPDTPFAHADRKACLPSVNCLPRWRGFNFNELKRYHPEKTNRVYEKDFKLINGWGFDFVRLPLDYKYFADHLDWLKSNEEGLAKIDEAVRYAEKYSCHLCISMYHAPGYTKNIRPDKKSLWQDQAMQDVFNFHWEVFTRRYKGISNRQLSFNPVNEPTHLSAEQYKLLIQNLLKTIHSIDKERLVICDGRTYGTVAPTELLELPVSYSTRGFKPNAITHYRTDWVPGSHNWPVPAYPYKNKNGKYWNRQSVKDALTYGWLELQKNNRGIMVGMFGCWNETPHAVTLALLRDYLSIWNELGWGWALWSLRGPGGIIDSGRRDVAYVNLDGSKLDKEFLELLRHN